MGPVSGCERLWKLCFDDCAVLNLDGVEEGHRFAKFGANLFDGMVAFLLAELLELLTAGVLVFEEALGEGAVLDVFEDALHGLLHFRSDDARAGDVVTPLGGVGDGVAHVLEATAIEEIDDELELVKDLEVGEFGLVARLGENLEARLDERGGAAAEDGLLAKEIGLRLFGEGGLENTAACSADALCVGQRDGEGFAGGVLLHSDERGDAAAFGEDLTDAVAGALRGDERD